MRVAPVGRDQLDAVFIVQFLRQGVAVVGHVADETFWVLFTGDALDSLLDQFHFRRRRTGDGNPDRQTMAVDHCHPLRPFAALGFADSGTPFFAAAKLSSMNDSDQSNLPRRSRSSMIVSQMSCHVPSRRQSWKRRWQVEREGYFCGSSAHCAPVRSIHKMPLSTSRSPMRGRPFPSARRFGFGITGSIISHCLSVKSISSLDQISHLLSIFWKNDLKSNTYAIHVFGMGSSQIF